MTTDDNTPADDLAPRHEQALGRVAPASESTRKAHIEAALEHLDDDRRWPRLVAAAISVAAAAVAAFAIGRATAPDPLEPIVTGPTTTIAKTSLAFCNDQFDDDANVVHTYEVDDVDYAIVESGGEVFIVDVARCTYITQFPDRGE